MNWRSTRPTKSHSGSRPTSVERDTMNHLYFGDNLDVLRRYVDDESVDLIYLDPPFNSQADYNVLFAEQDGTKAASQIKAFHDTWHWDESAERSYDEFITSAPY